MSRASGVLVGLIAIAGIARADEEPIPEAAPSVSTSAKDARGGLQAQIADEQAVLAKTSGTVGTKIDDVDRDRSQRLAAAYRILRTENTVDPIAAARRRAAARYLVARDLGERRLLADERGQLDAATKRTSDDAAKLASIELPTKLARPAKGEIVRHFGTLVHDRSKATLARRGLDIETVVHAAVSAPADGTVRYAGPIRGLDRGLLIDHGTYWTVLGKLGDITVPVGAHVTAGDVVGRAARSRVYFEVRIKVHAGGLPIDPEPLLAGESE